MENKKNWAKRLLKLICWSLGIIIAIAILLCIFSGTILKNYLEKHSKELIGRKLTVERIYINPLFGTLNSTNLVVFEQNDRTPFVRFDKLEYRMNLFSLLGKKFKVNKIHFTALDINIIQNGKNFNFDDIVTHLQKDSGEKKNNSYWTIDLNNIKILQSDLIYRDVQVGSKFNINQLSINIPRIYLSGQETNAGIDFKFGSGGELTSKLSYNNDKSKYLLDLNINNFDSEQLLPYLQQYLNVSQTNGRINLNTKIEGNTEHIIDADISGTASLIGGEVKDKNGNMIFATDSVIAKINRLNFEQGVATFDELVISGAQTQYTINKDSTDNFKGLLDVADTQESIGKEFVEQSDLDFLEEIGLKDSTVNPDTHKQMELLIHKLRIRNGKVTYTDNTLPKVFRYTLSEVTTSCDDFRLEKHNRLTGNAVLGKSGKISLDWVTDFKSMRNMDMMVSMNNIDIRDFTPYSSYYVGNNIESGIMRIVSHNTVKDNKLEGDNKIEIYNPRVSKRLNKEPIYKLPIRFGVYVLTDRKHNMNISLPVSGDLDNPKFSYRKLIFKALANLFIKVSTAPFTAIGELFGEEKENWESIYFDSRVSDFSPQEYAKLEEMVRWMEDKEELKFEFIQWINITNLISKTDSTSFSSDSINVLNQEKILALTNERNENLRKYLIRMNLSETRFTISIPHIDSLKNYKGKDRFTIVTSLEGDDEDLK